MPLFEVFEQPVQQRPCQFKLNQDGGIPEMRKCRVGRQVGKVICAFRDLPVIVIRKQNAGDFLLNIQQFEFIDQCDDFHTDKQHDDQRRVNPEEALFVIYGNRRSAFADLIVCGQKTADHKKQDDTEVSALHRARKHVKEQDSDGCQCAQAIQSDDLF